MYAIRSYYVNFVFMEMLIIRSESKSNIRLLMELAKKMGEKPVLESSDNTEDKTLV